MTTEESVIAAGRVLAARGLVDAFGHVSACTPSGEMVITPARPLSRLRRGDALPTVSLEDDGLAPGVPKEAWIHLEIYRARPDVGGICRAQPPTVAAASAADTPIVALHGQGAFVGSPVPIHDDARLVRDRAAGRAVAAALSTAHAVVLRGNGAVTVGASPGEAAARMVVLERSAELNLAAAAVARIAELTPDEVAAWKAVAPEILGRLWDHLSAEALADDGTL